MRSWPALGKKPRKKSQEFNPSKKRKDQQKIRKRPKRKLKRGGLAGMFVFRYEIRFQIAGSLTWGYRCESWIQIARLWKASNTLTMNF